jgi:hypothetical protein
MASVKNQSLLAISDRLKYRESLLVAAGITK